MKHEPSPADKLAMWKAVRMSPLAHEAVKLGVAWSLKCAILNDGKRPEEITLTRLIAAQTKADATAERIKARQPLFDGARNLGIMNPKDAETALAMYQRLGVLEAETQVEINGTQTPP